VNAAAGEIETAIPARLDRLPWSRFHWTVVIGLGAVWILDGLEATIVGSVAARLTEKGSGISIGAGGIGIAAAFYVAGGCLGALFFGQLTDRFGRKRLFLLTLGVYIAATVSTAFAFAPWYLYLARFLTGAGIGGEYAAINSAIDELIPARVRGRVDLMINGSYWVGAGIGSVAALLFLDTDIREGLRLAARVRLRRRARPDDHDRAAERAREPALAVHPRTRGRGREDHRLDRVGDRAGVGREAPRP
jgi:MFS family permease